MKYEWRKKDKTLYLPKNQPEMIDVPAMNYLVLEGHGNPNDSSFAEAVEGLYAMAYGIRMLPKQGITPEGYFEYTVFPLEGVWDLDAQGVEMMVQGAELTALKEHFIYKVMIRQPDFVTPDLVEMVRERVMKKKKNPRIAGVSFESMDEGKALQIMHLGSYDSEVASFDRLEAYAEANGLVRQGHQHKEIYLTDPKKVAPEKLKTTLRIWVQ